MISTIIALALLFVAVKLMLNRHERHIEQFRRDLDSIRLALEDTQSDLLTINGNVLNTYGMLQQVRYEIKEDKVKIPSNEIISKGGMNNGSEN